MNAYPTSQSLREAVLAAVVEREEEQLIAWRYRQLRRAGADRRAAQWIAESLDVDLHKACELLLKGCPSDLAVKILL